MTQAESYLNSLESMYGWVLRPTKGVSVVDQAWGKWESEGIKRPGDAHQSSEQVRQKINSYYQHLLTAANFEGTAPQLFYGEFQDRNAFAQSFGDGSWVVAIDSFLDSFLMESLTTAFHCAFTKPSDARLEEYKDFFAMSFRACSTTALETRKQTEDFFTKIVLDDFEISQAGAVCASAVVTFILAHELGHHVLGHEGRFQIAAGEAGEMTLTPESLSHQQEFAADLFGFQIMSELLKDKDNWLGADKRLLPLPLVYFEILHYRNILLNRTQEADSHPSPRRRKSALRKELMKLGYSAEDLAICDTVDEVLVYFTSDVLPSDLRKIRARGEDLY